MVRLDKRRSTPLAIRYEKRTVELNLQRASNDVFSLLNGTLVRQSDYKLARPRSNIWDLSAEHGGVIDCDRNSVVPETMEENDTYVIACLK